MPSNKFASVLPIWLDEIFHPITDLIGGTEVIEELDTKLIAKYYTDLRN